MLTVKRSDQRGKVEWEWLKSFHSFSFGEYYDPNNMNFGTLRVINDDTVLGGGGFPYHPHKNMEIITYVLEGALEHKDSMGSNEVIRAFDVQKMSAGRGIFHSEFNHSKTDTVKLLQIWVIPDKLNIEPSYEQISLKENERTNKFQTVVSPKAKEGIIHIHQDLEMSVAKLSPGTSLKIANIEGRGKYLHIAGGKITSSGVEYVHGDALMLEGTDSIEIEAIENSELVLFDLAMN